jgi:predicted metal-dependent hydrolase
MKNGVLAQLNLVGTYEITLGEKVVPYTLKRSSVARLVWLKIQRQTGLTVTIPRTYQIKQISAYLRANSAWILRHLAKYEMERNKPPENKLPAADTILYLGKPLTISIALGHMELPAVKLENNKLIINMGDSGSKSAALALEIWMRQQALQLIIDKANRFSKMIGVAYHRISIRDQRSRWGSCSRLKNLNFNWRLVMAPEAVLDYVIIHELCHLKEMNHSKTFWSVVARYCPRWREDRKWLNQHSKELRGILPCN